MGFQPSRLGRWHMRWRSKKTQRHAKIVGIQQRSCREWLLHYMKRNPNVSLRTPVANSLARAASFNRATVKNFFTMLIDTIRNIRAAAFTIHNLDESGCTTVHNVPKVLAPKGRKLFGHVTSQKRGELVTICSVISACGTSLPPVFVFPRKEVKNYMMIGAPEGSLGLASGNGWMKSELFSTHASAHNRPCEPNRTKTNNICDGQPCKPSFLGCTKTCKGEFHTYGHAPSSYQQQNSTIRTVFDPFKTYFNTAANNFML